MPILLVLASMLSGIALSTFSTATSTYIAYTVPVSRRAEAVGYGEGGARDPESR